jgi:hypothetical protein
MGDSGVEGDREGVSRVFGGVVMVNGASFEVKAVKGESSGVSGKTFFLVRMGVLRGVLIDALRFACCQQHGHK